MSHIKMISMRKASMLAFAAARERRMRSSPTGLPETSSKLVRSIEKPATTAGSHVVEWDGKDSAGNALSDGAYEVRVLGKVANGNPVCGSVIAAGRVTAVSSENDEVLLSLGDVIVPMDRVLTFRTAQQTTE